MQEKLDALVRTQAMQLFRQQGLHFTMQQVAEPLHRDLCGGSFVRRCFSAAASPRQNSGCHSSRMPMSAQTIFPHSGAEIFAICSGL